MFVCLIILVIVSIKQAMIELRGVNWSSLGDHLGIPDYEKRIIEQANPSEQLRLMKVLDWWIENDCNITWTRLAVALEEMHLYSLKESILLKYCPVPLMSSNFGSNEMASTDGRLGEDLCEDQGKH